MKNIKFAFWSSLLFITLFWMISDSFIPSPFTYFSFRNVFVQYSGIIAIACMSITLLLAIRPAFIEKRLHGLDKMYRLHKWLGIAALVFSLLHWWFAQGSKWLVQAGIIDRPQYRHRHAGENAGTIQHFLNQYREFAEMLGEWMFYLFLILMLIALIKLIPYHTFKKTHKLFAVAYIILVFHSIILFKSDYWMQPIGWINMLLFATGLISSIIILLGKTGASKKAQGHITDIVYYPELKSTNATIEINSNWQGHEAGQFVFIKFNQHEEAHPFTIASFWNKDRKEIDVVIKALGDFTNTIHDTLNVGDKVEIEGPYGEFTFLDSHTKQIWIGGGIGSTPFIAQMKSLETEGGTHKDITFYHATREYNEEAINSLEKDADDAQINYNLIIEQRDGYLTGEKIAKDIPDWKSHSIWFSGPLAFKKALLKYFRQNGYNTTHFHEEIFSMR